ncbi:50S ribosomal protein L5 [Candidatus Vidania fulgoroideae]|nr:50S ribosomal protein L5 [Candidatus Vidania fulgoroideae]
MSYISKLKKFFSLNKKKILKKLKIKNIMQIPKISKIIINVSLGLLGNNSIYLDSVLKNLSLITSQKPLIIKSKKSISNFKIRKNTNIALKVTLRNDFMYDFLYKFINLTCPRIRDFKGFPLSSFDENCNFNLGLKESYVFPEINKFENFKNNFGMNITIVISTYNIIHSKYILNFFNFPFN